jgi:hypothetical protein
MTQEISQITTAAKASAAVEQNTLRRRGLGWRACGNAQRLPNGNTLINEASFGRVFEVTPQGEAVWEFVNPYFGGPPNVQTNIVFGAHRYTLEEIAAATIHGMRERPYASATKA